MSSLLLLFKAERPTALFTDPDTLFCAFFDVPELFHFSTLPNPSVPELSSFSTRLS